MVIGMDWVRVLIRVRKWVRVLVRIRKTRSPCAYEPKAPFQRSCIRRSGSELSGMYTHSLFVGFFVQPRL